MTRALVNKRSSLARATALCVTTEFSGLQIKMVEVKKGEPHYFIHYSGWNVKWDDWVEADRLLPMTEQNLKKAEELKAQVGDGKKGAKKAKRKGEDDDESSSKGKRKKKKSDSSDDDEEDTLDKDEGTREQREVQVQIPVQLKKVLIDDWDAITNKKQLVLLPVKITVRQILDNYIKSESTKRKAHSQTLLEEFCNGMREYFVRGLDTVLLYKFERPQYTAQLAAKDAKHILDTYGGIHLLRLFVKLPELLAQTELTKDEHTVLQQQIAALIKYMAATHDAVFSASAYMDTDDAYRAKVAALG